MKVDFRQLSVQPVLKVFEVKVNNPLKFGYAKDLAVKVG